MAINPVTVYHEFAEQPAWEEWFAWHPVKINNKRIWGKKIYRRKCIIDIHVICGNAANTCSKEHYKWAYVSDLFELMNKTDLDLYMQFGTDFTYPRIYNISHFTNGTGSTGLVGASGVTFTYASISTACKAPYKIDID